VHASLGVALSSRAHGGRRANDAAAIFHLSRAAQVRPSRAGKFLNQINL
jgi:hypothetical protein